MEFLDIVLILGGVILLIVGFIGCFIPVLPGPPLTYIGLLLLQLSSNPPFSTEFMLFWLFITIVVTVLDYVIPILGTKKLGGSKWGIIGSGVGLVVGIFFFPPFGLIIGPALGAWIGELSTGKSGEVALKAALGSFLGFIAGTFIKLISSLIMSYYFVTGIIDMV